MALTVASFFSGIGGLDLGFERAGFSVTVQCEIDPFCVSILKKHWPSILRFQNIKEMSDADVPFSDVWTGGFPCQDVSLARMGPRAGLKGKKSGLFYEFVRLARRGRPRIILIENVPGLLSSHGGRDFGIVIRTLAELGYSVGWRVFNSRYFGVPQSRQRVYIIGCYRNREGTAQILFERERGARDASESKPNGKAPVSPFKESLGNPRKGPIVQALAYCLYACSARHTGTDWSRNYVIYPPRRVRRLMPVECERLQGFPENWTLPDTPTADAEKMDSLRYQAAGNAVTVPVAEWLAARIAEYLLTSQRSVPQETEDAVADLRAEATDSGEPALGSLVARQG